MPLKADNKKNEPEELVDDVTDDVGCTVVSTDMMMSGLPVFNAVFYPTPSIITSVCLIKSIYHFFLCNRPI